MSLTRTEPTKILLNLNRSAQGEDYSTSQNIVENQSSNKLDEDETEKLQTEIEAATTPVTNAAATDSNTPKLNHCHEKGIKKTNKEKAHCFLAEVESQVKSGANCTPGTDLNMGEQVVNRYAQV